MDRPWTPRRQGDAGELSAMQWLTYAGALVCRPMFENSHYDLIADWGDCIERVQVKTSTCLRLGRYEVTLATRGGNQSWSGLVKVLDNRRVDALFVHVGDGRRWYIPAAALGGGTGIRLGGPKYAAYEIEPGEILQGRPRVRAPAGPALGEPSLH